MGRLRPVRVGGGTDPHVAEWWSTNDDPTLTTSDPVVEKYGPRAEDASWVTACVITVGDRPIGYTQFYSWFDVVDEAREMGGRGGDEATPTGSAWQ
jgi:hypothetical protein